MSRIEKLAIRGIRSFDPQEEVKIEFFRPLTLIQGHNGSGKTTIIECLKMASCGSLPPLATNGKTFICDPKINGGSTETKASIKLKFLTPRDKEVLIIRNFQLSLKNNKYEFKRLEQLLKSYNSNGELVTINSTCIDIDKQVPLLMHSSRAILENVIFCHQEDTNWPFTEAGNLKKVFDEIFDTAKYTKALEDLKEIKKNYDSKTKELKIKIELIGKDFEQYKKINTHIDSTKTKIDEINFIVEELSENLNKANKDYKQIVEYEEQFRQKENEINMTKMRIEEKSKQIANIKSDPYFQDYTETEDYYRSFINNYNSFMANANNSDESKYTNIKMNLDRFNRDNRILTEEIYNIDAGIKSKNENLAGIVNYKNEMIAGLNNLEGLGINFTESVDYYQMLEELESKQKDVKQKLNSIEEKKKMFEMKVSEKLNDFEVQRVLIETKRREIEVLLAKKNEMMRMLNNRNNNMNNLNEINSNIFNLQQKIGVIENNEIIIVDNEIMKIQTEKNSLIQRINFDKNTDLKSFNCNSSGSNEVLILYISKMKEGLNNLTKLEGSIKDRINNFNQTFGTNYSLESNSLITALVDMIICINRKKDEVIEEKQNIREQNLMINTQIEMCERNLNKLNDEIKISNNLQVTLFNEIKYLFDKLNIPLEEFNLNINSEVNKILIFKTELETVIKNLNSDKTTKSMEIKFIEEYISSLKEESECALCNKEASKTEINEISKNLTTKIFELNKIISQSKSKLEEKNLLLEEINKSDIVLKKLRDVSDDNKKNLNRQKELEKELNSFLSKRKTFENNSKEKTLMILQLEKFLGAGSSSNEEIIRLKTELVEVRSNLDKLSICLNLPYITDNILTTLDEKLKRLTDLNRAEHDLKYIDASLSKNTDLRGGLLEKLSRMYAELRRLENEKANLSKFSDVSEINSKISEIEQEIHIRNTEIQTRELEMNKLNEVKLLLTSKGLEFDKMYQEKNHKYKSLLDTINLFKIRIELALGEIEKIMNRENTNANNDEHTTIERVFGIMIEQMKTDKQTKENRKTLIEKEITRFSEELNLQETEKKKMAMKENLYKNNLLIYSLKSEIKELSDFLLKNEGKIMINSKISSAKEKINEKLTLLNSQYNLNLGKLHELDNNLTKLKTEVRNDCFFDIEMRFSKMKVEYMISIETSKQVENYSEALDQSLLKYHAKRMEEINKLINYYWGMTYKGQDIKWIEIRSDVEKTGRSRSYNYRIVYGTSEDQELDMRGRCSAGQKVLASIIIRLALAETFCNNCGILCLDEPTTNLDDQHIKSLAKALREIIQSRSEDQNFQLIVITHDPTFVDLIGSDFCDSFWCVSKNERRFSTISLKPINAIFN